MTPARPDRYVFITPVWGDAYVERFVKVSLPSQLSTGNLGAVPADRARYLIYTRREWARAIRRSAAFRRLKELVPTSVLSLDDLPDPRTARTPHQLQTAAYTRGIRSAAGTSAAFVFLTPDILVGDGGYANMVRLTDAGRRVVLVAGVRMTADGAVARVARHRDAGRPAAPIPPRELVRACLDNLHPISEGHVVRAGRVLAPQHLYWRVGDHGLLARGFHLHPLVVWPRNPAAMIRNTLDDEYISRACPDRADWYTVTDSDELCVMEFSEARHKFAMVATRTLTDAQVLRFIHHGTNPDHRLLVRENLRFHGGELDPAGWRPVEDEAEALVGGYLEVYAADGPPPEEPTEPAVRAQVPGLLSRVSGTGSRSLARAALLGLAVPFWAVYRLLNYKVYRYLDRLNSEVIELRMELRATRDRLQQQFDALHRDPEPPAPEPTPRTRTVRKSR